MEKNTLLKDEKAIQSNNIIQHTTLTSVNNLEEKVNEETDVFDDIRYICNSTSIITEALQAGWDVAQLSNGDVIVTEVITVNILYSWDRNKQKLVKISHS